MSDCELLQLEMASVETLRQRFPEFDQLLRERVAQYQEAGQARIPIDFAEELLPADARASDKTADADERSDALARSGIGLPVQA